MAMQWRQLTAEAQTAMATLARARTAPARAVERARSIRLASAGTPVPAIAQARELTQLTGRTWLKRFTAEGLEGGQDRPRAGWPALDQPAQVSAVMAAALPAPQQLGLPLACWTWDRLEASRNAEKKSPSKRSRIDARLRAEGLRWAMQETWCGARVAPECAKKRGAVTRSIPNRLRSVRSCVWRRWGRSPPSVRRGQPWVRAEPASEPPCPAERAPQESDAGRRGTGDLVGAFRPASGEALPQDSRGRTITHWGDVLGRVEVGVPEEMARL
jgi:transposase